MRQKRGPSRDLPGVQVGLQAFGGYRTAQHFALAVPAPGGVALVLASRQDRVDAAVNAEYPKLTTTGARQLSGISHHDGYAAPERAASGLVDSYDPDCQIVDSVRKRCVADFDLWWNELDTQLA